MKNKEQEPEKIELEEIIQFIDNLPRDIKNFIGAASILLGFGAMIVSVFREKYIENIAHSECNRMIAGFFNKTLTENGYECYRHGELLHTAEITPQAIPSPFLLLAIYTVIILTYLLYRRKR